MRVGAGSGISRSTKLPPDSVRARGCVRGDRREDIFEDDEDRRALLNTLSQVVSQFNWLSYAWCLMDNHYHLLIRTPDGNLSKGMR